MKTNDAKRRVVSRSRKRRTKRSRPALATDVKGLKLDTLTRYFDDLIDRMQAPGARAAMQAAFDASPEELGRAAVAGARRARAAALLATPKFKASVRP